MIFFSQINGQPATSGLRSLEELTCVAECNLPEGSPCQATYCRTPPRHGLHTAMHGTSLLETLMCERTRVPRVVVPTIITTQPVVAVLLKKAPKRQVFVSIKLNACTSSEERFAHRFFCA
uniref:Uncharacterized protein n=1 Tax=Trichuris muris TaxID=70415 RepID=A0A5S6Q9Q2_TRIMR